MALHKISGFDHGWVLGARTEDIRMTFVCLGYSLCLENFGFSSKRKVSPQAPPKDSGLHGICG